MTRENHIKNLQSMIDDAEDMGLYDEDVESLQYAIKALEQEPCDDAISRQAVEKITWEEPSYTDALNVLTEVRDKVRALPSVNPQEPKWIPVSERLPEGSGDYLVCGHGKMWICEMINLYGVRGWCNDVKNPIVEAWMPLPQPYKAESE